MSLRIQKRNIITYGAMGGSGIAPKNCVETLFFKLFQGFPWEMPLEAILRLLRGAEHGCQKNFKHHAVGNLLNLVWQQKYGMLLKFMPINTKKPTPTPLPFMKLR